VWDFLSQYGLFLAETVTLVIAIAVVIGIAVSAGTRNRGGDDGQIEVRKLNERYYSMRDVLMSQRLDEKDYKKHLKEEKKAEKKAEKNKQHKSKQVASAAAEQTSDDNKPDRCVYLLRFDGDIRAAAVESLREEISAILSAADAGDEVVVVLESGGGMVHSYGFASSQLARIRDKGLKLTICIDKVAASGGYMMACVADHIIAAPFAMVGSIGVVAQVPNFHRLLKKNDVDVEVMTAGEHKRTLTMFGRNTDAARDKFREELEDTHALFKAFVHTYRPDLDISKVSTGEVWYGQQALELKLIDAIGTSDDYLQQVADTATLLDVRYVEKKNLQERLGLAVESAVERGVDKALARLSGRHNWFN